MKADRADQLVGDLRKFATFLEEWWSYLPDDLDVGIDQLDRRRDPARDPAGGDGDQNLLRVRALFHDLETDGAVAGDDGRFFPGVDGGHAALFGQALDRRLAGQGVVAAKIDLGAVAFRALDLIRAGGVQHDHGDGNAQRLAREGEALREIAA